MNVNWLAVALRLPAIIQQGMTIAESIKGARGAEKKSAVLAAIPQGLGLAEFASGVNLLNDDAVAGLISEYIDAEAQVRKVRGLLEQLLAAKAAVEPS